MEVMMPPNDGQGNRPGQRRRARGACVPQWPWGELSLPRWGGKWSRLASAATRAGWRWPYGACGRCVEGIDTFSKRVEMMRRGWRGLRGPGRQLGPLGFCEELDLDPGRVRGELRGERASGDGFLEGELGHDEAGFGEKVRVLQSDYAVPDERGVAVHAEAGEEAAGEAGGFVNARK